MPNRLLYLAHTSDAVREQALYSILSALAHRGDAPLAIHVYTDVPQAFARVDGRVEARLLAPDEVLGWKGPAGYNLRTKPVAMGELAARHPGDKLLFVDADTVFTGPVDALFQRIAPGAAVMHEREYDVATSDLAVVHRFRRHMRRATFRGAPVPLRAHMWNSGTVGLDPADFAVLGDWLAFVDELFPRTRRWLAEQYGIASLLQQRGSAISEAADVVVHYWFDKPSYVEALRAALEATRGRPLDDALAYVREHPIARPRRAASYGAPANFFQRVFGW